MNLEVGKKYKDRKGDRVTIISDKYPGKDYFLGLVCCADGCEVPRSYFSDGRVYSHQESNNDIVAEWHDKPDPGEGWRLLHPDEDVEEGDEYFSDCDGRWMQSNNYRTNNCIQTREVTYRRRIAPQYVPYTWDDREELRGRWLKSKHAPHCEFVVLEFKSMSGIHLRVNGIDAVALLEHYVWLDGTPCGKKVVQ